MKPSERIEELYPGEIGLNNRMTEDEIEKAMLWRKITAIMDYLDEQAELLDTHTENETKAHKPNTCACPCHNKHDTHYPL